MTSLTFGRYTVEVSNPEKPLFAEAGISKSDLIDYYRDVAQDIVPYLRERPLMMHRFPDGIDEDGFYQKEIGNYFPDWIERVEVTKERGTTTYVVCNNAATLAYLANQACITPHVWLSRVDCLEFPDQLVFDLDPPGESFEPVRFATRMLKKLLDEIELPCFVKTTGSRGLHVVVPLDRSADFDAVRACARDVAAFLAKREPKRLTVEHRKNKRRGRLYLDTSRNAYAQTVAAPLAVRPYPGAPVAAPLDWSELSDRGLHSQSYTIKTIRRRLDQGVDPWRGMRTRAHSLSAPQERLHDLDHSTKT